MFAALFDIADIDILKDYKSFVSEQIKSGTDPEVIRKSVNNKFPQLKSLSDLIPKTRAEAYTLIGLMLTLITLTINSCEKYQTKELKNEIKQKIIDQSFQNYYIMGDSVRVYVQSNNRIESNTK